MRQAVPISATRLDSLTSVTYTKDDVFSKRFGRSNRNAFVENKDNGTKYVQKRLSRRCYYYCFVRRSFEAHGRAVHFERELDA